MVGDAAGGSVTPDRGGPPGPPFVEVPAAIVQAMIDHARAEYPNEMCGLLSGDRDAAAGGRILEWFPTRNELASRYRYSIHPDDKFRILTALDDAEQVVWGIAHSHVASPAVPSTTDIGQSWWFPEAIWILVSLADDEADPTSGAPSVRAWRIAGEQRFEVELRVVE